MRWETCEEKPNRQGASDGARSEEASGVPWRPCLSNANWRFADGLGSGSRLLESDWGARCWRGLAHQPVTESDQGDSQADPRRSARCSRKPEIPHPLRKTHGILHSLPGYHRHDVLMDMHDCDPPLGAFTPRTHLRGAALQVRATPVEVIHSDSGCFESSNV